MRYATWAIVAIVLFTGAAAIYGLQKTSVFTWDVDAIYLILRTPVLNWLYGVGLLSLSIHALMRIQKAKSQRKAFIKEVMRKHRELYAGQSINYANYSLEKSASLRISHHPSNYCNQTDVYRPSDFFRPPTHEEHLNQPHQEHLESGHCYRMTYQDADDNITERYITVKRAASSGKCVYIKAFCHLRSEMRTFRGDRIIGYLVDTETGELIDPSTIEPRKSTRKKR